MASWIAGGILLTCFVYIIVCNLMMLILSLTTHRFHSVVPLVGAVLGVIGLFLIPVSMPHWTIYFLPVVLDWGTIAFLLSLPVIINDMFFVSYSVKIEEGLLLFMRKGEVFQKIPVSEICRCERVRGRIKVWYGEQPYYGICSFSTRWENAVEVYMMLEKIVGSKRVTNVA